MNLFQLGDFILNSGAKSTWKLECDALTDGDVQALAHMIRQLVGPFYSVQGIPRGGLRLAAALRPFATGPGGKGPHLIVDDVLTTGGSLERARQEYLNRLMSGRYNVEAAVAFARGPCPPWVKAVFQMPEALWLKEKAS